MKRIFFLFIFIIMAVIVYMERTEFLFGLKGYLYGDTDIKEIQALGDLPPPKGLYPQDVKAIGIPDYKNVCRFSFQEEFLTCFRMVGFANRLLVCSDKGLDNPEAIDEIIKPRKFQGRLTRLNNSPYQKTLRRCFKKTGGVHLSSDGSLLLDGQSSLPPLKKIVFLSFCLVVCCFSFFRFLK